MGRPIEQNPQYISGDTYDYRPPTTGRRGFGKWIVAGLIGGSLAAKHLVPKEQAPEVLKPLTQVVTDVEDAGVKAAQYVGSKGGTLVDNVVNFPERMAEAAVDVGMTKLELEKTKLELAAFKTLAEARGTIIQGVLGLDKFYRQIDDSIGSIKKDVENATNQISKTVEDIFKPLMENPLLKPVINSVNTVYSNLHSAIGLKPEESKEKKPSGLRAAEHKLELEKEKGNKAVEDMKLRDEEFQKTTGASEDEYSKNVEELRVARGLSKTDFRKYLQDNHFPLPKEYQ